MDSSNGTASESQNEQRGTEIDHAYNELVEKVNELRELKFHLEDENAAVKKRYNDLKQRLKNLNRLAAQNANTFLELYDDAHIALQMGQLLLLNSPSAMRRADPVQMIQSNSPKPSTSVTSDSSEHSNDNSRNNVRRRLHIEPMNMTEVQEALVAASEEEIPQEENVEAIQELSVIMEEETLPTTTLNNLSSISNASNISINKELIVHVHKLSASSLKELAKVYKISDETLSELSDNSLSFLTTSRRGPNFSSTPLKLETMNSLGLVPSKGSTSKGSNNFVNVRKRNNGGRNISVESITIISPKKEKSPSPMKRQKSPPQKKTSEINDSPAKTRKRSKTSVRNAVFENKRIRLSPEVETEVNDSNSENKENAEIRIKQRISSPLPATKVRKTTSDVKRPKKEKKSLSKLTVVEKRKSPRGKVSQERIDAENVSSGRSRPRRNGAPQVLKEPSLKGKLRRN